jgi:tRNA-uridine 2-sulfurtransferase
MIPAPGDRIVVGMSGGVDSSLAAALLKDQGYQVIGVMLRLWSDPGTLNRCCAPDAVLEARQVAGQLEIPFYVIDAKEAFYQSVVVPFISAYQEGETPNPCLRCNSLIRWNFLLTRARALGAEFIATGHYARLRRLPSGEVQLLKSQDRRKDQSYFLHVLTQDDLQRTVFPLADLSKTQVRQLAADKNLSAAERPDSQDLCFVGQGGDYREFLRRTDPGTLISGPIKNFEGEGLGEHNGLANYTIGQRKGLGVSGQEPYYVARKDPANNVLIVGYKDQLGSSRFTTHQVNWISGNAPNKPFRAQIKTRYQSTAVPGTVTPQEDLSTRVQLDEKIPDITPGQAAVFYQNEVCLGGGIIRSEGL